MTHDELIREQIALEILDYAKKCYTGAAQTDDVRVLEIAEYLDTQLKIAADIARGKANDLR